MSNRWVVGLLALVLLHLQKNGCDPSPKSDLKLFVYEFWVRRSGDSWMVVCSTRIASHI